MLLCTCMSFLHVIKVCLMLLPKIEMIYFTFDHLCLLFLYLNFFREYIFVRFTMMQLRFRQLNIINVDIWNALYKIEIKCHVCRSFSRKDEISESMMFNIPLLIRKYFITILQNLKPQDSFGRFVKNLSIFRKWTIPSESTIKPTGNCFE